MLLHAAYYGSPASLSLHPFCLALRPLVLRRFERRHLQHRHEKETIRKSDGLSHTYQILPCVKQHVRFCWRRDEVNMVGEELRGLML